MRNFIISRSLLLAVAPILLCLAGSESVLAQNSADISALPQHIDSFLTDKKTPTKPLAGMGADFVSLGSQYGVDPRLIVAISGAESSFGAHVCTQSNAWNWFWEGPCPKSPFDSWDSGAKTVTHFMHKSYLLKGYNTIPLIGAKFCASGCEHWVPNVTEFFSELGGNVNDLAWEITPSTAQPTSPAMPAERPAPAIVASLMSQTLSATHWWQKNPPSITVTVQATIHGPMPLARSVKLVRSSGLVELATLHAEGADESGDAVFTGEATVPQVTAGTLNLQVTAAFPKAISRQKISSNEMSVTSVAAGSNLPLMLAIAGSLAVATLIGMLWLVMRLRRTKGPVVSQVKQAA